MTEYSIEVDPRITNAQKAIDNYIKDPSPIHAIALAIADDELGLAKLDGIDISEVRKTIDSLLEN
ncbi:MAG: hypothetical protein ABH840_03075 [Nanoarchaeota archaeon]